MHMECEARLSFWISLSLSAFNRHRCSVGPAPAASVAAVHVTVQLSVSFHAMHEWDAPSSHTSHAHIISSLKAAGSSLGSHNRRITGGSRKNKGRASGMGSTKTPNSVFWEEEEIEEPSVAMNDSKPRRKKWSRKNKPSPVLLEGYVAADEGEEVPQGVPRTRSLTDDDLDELKGCLDLGFGFNYEEIPELRNTLPALELCYSMSQRFLDDQQQQRSPVAASVASEEACGATSIPIANWKISSPGDHPEEVKARLKFWAQAVACTVRLCS